MSDLSSQPTPIQSIYDMYRSGLLVVNRTYQRKLVWTLTEKQKLIDSILNDYPIPLVLLAERRTSPTTFEIIDGLQRLHTIVTFIENGFPLFDGRYFNVDEFTQAKEQRELGKFDEGSGEKISRGEVAKILNYVLSLSIIRNASDAVVTDVFGRINSYGHRLSDQERRQAGLVSEFAQFVRIAACEIRGDVSMETLPLFQMPEISVDLPKTKYGYSVQAENVFWVRQGILRSTDLRDSVDEQVIADITACLISDDLIERSKEVLDRIYDSAQPESTAVAARFSAYGGSEKIRTEIKYCLELVEKIVEAGGNKKTLRSMIFPHRTNNPFTTIFSVIFLAIHELSFKEQFLLANPEGACGALTNVTTRLNTGKDALSTKERRQNINIVKGLLRDYFVTGDVSKIAFGARREFDIQNTLTRSQIETPSIELKQGLLRLDSTRKVDEALIEKVLQTANAIANIGPNSTGVIFIGVADNEDDAQKIQSLDNVNAVVVGTRYVVGIDREAKVLNMSPEKYFQMWRDKIVNSPITEALKSGILSNLDLCKFKGLHILIITVPAQKGVSLYNGKVFVRSGDQTIEASPEKIVAVAGRFGS